MYLSEKSIKDAITFMSTVGKEFGDKLSEEDVNKLNECLDNLKESHQKEDIGLIDSSLEKLNEEWQSITTKIYQQTEEPVTSEDNEEQATDVEYEEVK